MQESNTEYMLARETLCRQCSEKWLTSVDNTSMMSLCMQDIVIRNNTLLTRYYTLIEWTTRMNANVITLHSTKACALLRFQGKKSNIMCFELELRPLLYCKIHSICLLLPLTLSITTASVFIMWIYIISFQFITQLSNKWA